jgi:hypothetical protein
MVTSKPGVKSTTDTGIIPLSLHLKEEPQIRFLQACFRCHPQPGNSKTTEIKNHGFQRFLNR